MQYCQNAEVKEAFLEAAKVAVSAEVNKFTGSTAAFELGLQQMYQSALEEVKSRFEQIQREKDSVFNIGQTMTRLVETISNLKEVEAEGPQLSEDSWDAAAA